MDPFDLFRLNSDLPRIIAVFYTLQDVSPRSLEAAGITVAEFDIMSICGFNELQVSLLQHSWRPQIAP